MIKIVTDSATDVPDDLIRRYGITSVPNYVRIGQRVYRDMVEIDQSEILRRMVVDKVVVKTSQCSPGDFLQAYRELTADGSTVISIHLSSKLSGIYQSATLARTMLPDRDIHVVDTGTGSMASGFAVIAAARLAHLGKTREHILQAARAMAERARIFLTCDSLECICRNGRISRAQALIGSLFSIRPVLSVQDGVLAAVDRVRGAQKVIPRLVELCRQHIPEGTRVSVAVGHVDVLDRAKALAAELQKVLNIGEMFIFRTGAAITANLGPGTFGVMFCPEEPITS
ncbi:MAG TPA: DegV family protein [Bacillota bacterium]